MKEILNLQQDPENCASEIEGLIAKLKHLKHKINESYQEMERSYAQIRKRIISLSEDSCSHDMKLNRGIIDWLMRTGHFKSAYKMMKLHGLEVNHKHYGRTTVKWNFTWLRRHIWFCRILNNKAPMKLWNGVLLIDLGYKRSDLPLSFI